MTDRINVTRSSMPGLEEYIEELKPVWESRWLSNRAKLNVQLPTEAQLRGIVLQRASAHQLSLYLIVHQLWDDGLVMVFDIILRQLSRIL